MQKPRKPPQLLEGDALEAALQYIADYLVSRPKLEGASKAAGFGKKWIWHALNRSGAGDPRYLLRWPDREAEEKIQFIEAVSLSQRMFKNRFATTLMEESDRGVPKLQVHGGAVLYEKDLEALAICGGETPEAFEFAKLMGYVDFPYKHKINARGNPERIPLVLYEHVPATLRVHAARSLLPAFNPPETRHRTTSHAGTIMVTERPKYARDYVPRDNALRRDLQQRLADLRAKGPKNPLPLDARGNRTIPQVSASHPDDPIEGGAQPARQAPANIGRGVVPPNGFKVR
jgi:hypothetical protein